MYAFQVLATIVRGAALCTNGNCAVLVLARVENGGPAYIVDAEAGLKPAPAIAATKLKALPWRSGNLDYALQTFLMSRIKETKRLIAPRQREAPA